MIRGIEICKREHQRILQLTQSMWRNLRGCARRRVGEANQNRRQLELQMADVVTSADRDS